MNRISRFLLLLFLFAVFVTTATAKPFTAMVVDGASGEALIGASILVPNTDIGTTSDFYGVFQLDVPEGTTELYVRYSCWPMPNMSYCGQATGLIVLGGNSPICYGANGKESCQEGSLNPLPFSSILPIFSYLNQRAGQIDSAIVVTDSIPDLETILHELEALSNKYGCNLPVYHQPQNWLEPNERPVLHHTHPYQWLRGQMSGLIVSQPGNDPWGRPHLRYQGIHSLSQRADPLWVVDGMPAIDPLLLSGQSINEVLISRRPVDLVKHGLQAGAGVIEVRTQQYADQKLAVQYQGQLSFERPINLPAVATAAQYRQNPGGISDLGFATNWLEEVTRNAWSHQHQLSLSGYKKNTHWGSQGGYQQVQGVGRNSSWQQYSGRVHLQHSLWKNRLILKVQAAGQRRWGSQDYHATFFYASKFNPTAPVRFDGAPANPLLNSFYETSSLLLRNYFEIAPSLDYFNPVAIQETSSLQQQRANRWVQAESKLRITPQLDWQLAAGYQANDREWGEENPTYAFFRGNALTGLPGAANRREEQNRQEWVSSSLLYEKHFDKGLWEMKAGYHFQRFTLEDRQSEGQGFGDDIFNYTNFESFLTPQSTFSQNNYDETHRLIGFLASSNLQFNWLNWRVSFHEQGATRLGNNERWLSQYASDVEIDLSRLLDIYGKRLSLHGGYALIGNLPTDKSYAQGQYDPNRQLFVNANPDLRPEVRQIGQAGFRWESSTFFATVDYYGSNTRDPIVKIVRNDIPTEFNEFGANLSQVALRNRSWEFSAGFRVDKQVEWKSTFLWAFTRTYLEATGDPGPSAFFNIHGQRSTDLSGAGGFSWLKGIGLLEMDAPFGQLTGRQFDRRSSLSNGQLTHFGTFIGNGLPAPDEEFGVIGNGLPKHSYAWNNRLRWQDWQLDFLVRGERGHELAHLRRGELDPIVENAGLFPSSRNYLTSEYDLAGVKGFPLFSNRYIEKGNYLSLDYLSISRKVNLQFGRELLISISGQNLLLLTKYTGVDPSPRFVDEGPEINGSLPNLQARDGQLTPGVDRRYFYPRTQTFTLGIKWSI